MRRRLRRPRPRTLLAAAAVGGAITLTRRSAARARAIGPGTPPSWPPILLEPAAGAGAALDTDDPAVTAVDPTWAPGVRAPDLGDPTAPRWIAPLEGDCPLHHPVKANDRSRIFHPPNGRSYARTRADRCYADPEDAAADGYRAAKA